MGFALLFLTLILHKFEGHKAALVAPSAVDGLDLQRINVSARDENLERDLNDLLNENFNEEITTNSELLLQFYRFE
jgi:hypothetical protein